MRCAIRCCDCSSWRLASPLYAAGKGRFGDGGSAHGSRGDSSADRQRATSTRAACRHTALHWAAHHDDLDLGTGCWPAGADVKASNRYGVTPLALACINGNTAMVEKFIDAGADAKQFAARWRNDVETAARNGKVAP